MVHRAVFALVLLLAAPAAARAVTVEDLIALSKAGVTADILIAVIDADRTVFTLTPDEIVLLTNAGVPSAVVVKMLGTAREFVEEVPPPLIVGNSPPPAAVVVPTYIGLPFFVPPVIGVPPPAVPPSLTLPHSMHSAPFGRRFINDGWVEGRGWGRFINTP